MNRTTDMGNFTNLHVHSEYSIIDGMTSLTEMFETAEKLGQKAIALTDHGHMYGIQHFLSMSRFHPDVKPIVGCEIYLTDHYDHRLKDESHRKRYHLILLAKNYEGYQNLCRISTEAALKGMMNGKPRISHEYIASHRDGLICLSACIGGEIPQRILEGDFTGARKALDWYRSVFGDDFYLEVSLHRSDIAGNPQRVLELQHKANDGIFALEAETGVKVIATNDVHFARKEQAPVHDCLLAISCDRTVSDDNRLRYTGQEYIKSEEEMLEMFPDHPEAVFNTMEVADKIERYEIRRPVSIPEYPLPEGFSSSYEYLEAEAYAGLAERCSEGRLEEAKEWLAKELDVVKRKGCADYFLHCRELVKWAEANGIPVGPGRGSAAGMVLNWSLGITGPDPMKNGLLSERFYNNDAVSIPDIDFDFGQDSQMEIIGHLRGRFGEDNISRVITFGRFSPKSALLKVGQALGLPAEEARSMADHVPDSLFAHDEIGREWSPRLTLDNCIRYDDDFNTFYGTCSDVERRVIDYARELEGRICMTGIHACAVAILDNRSESALPRTVLMDRYHGTEEVASQYDGYFFDETGVMRLDILELHTLSRLEGCLSLIEERYGERVLPDDIPLDDKETLDIYRSGDTDGVFQFESEGMKEHLRDLYPDSIEDLTSMNALYRPGPMDLIPGFIKQKHLGDFPCEMEDLRAILAPTHGILVYQEQLMAIVKKVAGFSPEEADRTRKAIGKRKSEMIADLREKFLDRGTARGYDSNLLIKVWADLVSQGKYCFNKSHALCYTLLSYRCAWLKAHWPEEFSFWFKPLEI